MMFLKRLPIIGYYLRQKELRIMRLVRLKRAWAAAAYCGDQSMPHWILDEKLQYKLMEPKLGWGMKNGL